MQIVRRKGQELLQGGSSALRSANIRPSGSLPIALERDRLCQRPTAALLVDGVQAFRALGRFGSRSDFAPLISYLERSEGCVITDRRIYAGGLKSKENSLLMFSLQVQGFKVFAPGLAHWTNSYAKCRRRHGTRIEKECDVKLGIDLVGLKEKCDLVFCLTGDRDLAPALQEAREGLRPRVIILADRKSLSRKLAQLAAKVIYLDDVLPIVMSERVADPCSPLAA